MNFPSISSLIGWLFYLAYYTVGYVLHTNGYDRVQTYRDAVYGWFDALRAWAEWFTTNAANVVTAWAQGWINFLVAWKDWLYNSVGAAWAWINGVAASVVQWALTVRSSLQYFLENVWSWLVWFWANTAAAIKSYLGYAWSWLEWFAANSAAAILSVLGAAWTWVVWFWGNPVGVIEYYLGYAWQWLKWFFSNSAAVILSALGPAWSWLSQLFSDPWGVVTSVLGPAWQWLLSLFGLNPQSLLVFARDALTYWYNIWSLYRTTLVAFLSSPGEFVLAVIRDFFLDWLERLVADNW